MELTQLLLGSRRAKLIWLTLAVLLILIIAYYVLTRGSLTVTTNNPNAVIAVIKSSGTSNQQTTVATGASRLSTNLYEGTYEVFVSNKTQSTSQEITVKALHKNVYHLNLPNQIEAQSVLPNGVTGLTASSTQLQYVDSDTGTLTQVGASGIPTVVDPLHSFTSVKWANPGFGIGQASNGQLYTIENGSVNPLVVPFSYTNGVTVNYSVGPTGRVFVSYGSTIYVGQDGSGFHKYFTASSKDPQLFAGTSSLAVLNSTGEFKAKLTVISSSGSSITNEIDAGGIVWSPNDQEFVTTGDGNDAATLYTSTLKQTGVLLEGGGAGVNPNGAVWLDNEHLIYGRGQNLWEYNPVSRQANVLSSLSAGQTITNTFLSQDKTYVYLTGTNQTNGDILVRVGLTAQTQQGPSYASGLDVLYPNSTNKCSFSYSNFIRLDLIIATWTDQSYCMSQAQAQLNQYSLPASGFTIIFGGSSTPID